MLAQRPATRGHGNVNIMEKAAAYKRKKNLEIPLTFKGKSFSTMDKSILTNQMSQMNLMIGGGDDIQKNLAIDEMIAVEKERCLVFANNNPEIVLPDNLDIDSNDLVSTPKGTSPLETVGTADTSRGTPVVLTKVKPCRLSHPFKIN